MFKFTKDKDCRNKFKHLLHNYLVFLTIGVYFDVFCAPLPPLAPLDEVVAPDLFLVLPQTFAFCASNAFIIPRARINTISLKKKQINEILSLFHAIRLLPK